MNFRDYLKQGFYSAGHRAPYVVFKLVKLRCGSLILSVCSAKHSISFLFELLKVMELILNCHVMSSQILKDFQFFF